MVLLVDAVYQETKKIALGQDQPLWSQSRMVAFILNTQEFSVTPLRNL